MATMRTSLSPSTVLRARGAGNALALDAAACPQDPQDCLVYHEGPLMVWLRVPRRRLLALACESDDERTHPMLVCELGEGQAQRLLARQMTLGDAVRGALRWFDIPDYYAKNIVCRPRRNLPDDLPEMDGYLPEDLTAAVARAVAEEAKERAGAVLS